MTTKEKNKKLATLISGLLGDLGMADNDSAIVCVTDTINTVWNLAYEDGTADGYTSGQSSISPPRNFNI